MKDSMSIEAAEILNGLQESLSDAKGLPVEGIKKTIVYREGLKPVQKNESSKSHRSADVSR